MLKEKQKLRLYLIALAVVLLVIIALVVWHGGRSKAPEALPAVTPRPTQQVIVRERPVEKLIEVEKEVAVDEIRSGLNDMGVLLTEEYFFTDVVRFSSIKTLFSIELGITESSYLASYDGVVRAGVDFTEVSLRRDDATGLITVTMPAAEIVGVDIDPQSFQLYSEKTGLGNPISMADFNTSLVELEQTARDEALERGLLERARDNARQIVRNFIAGLVDTTRYTIRFETAS